jgi:hypothetical protein
VILITPISDFDPSTEKVLSTATTSSCPAVHAALTHAENNWELLQCNEVYSGCQWRLGYAALSDGTHAAQKPSAASFFFA